MCKDSKIVMRNLPVGGCMAIHTMKAGDFHSKSL